MYDPNRLGDSFDSEVATTEQVGIMVEAVADHVHPGDKEGLVTDEAISEVRKACFMLYDQGLSTAEIQGVLRQAVADVEAMKSNLDHVRPEDFRRGQS